MLNELIKRLQLKSKDAQKEKNETLKHHHLYAMQVDIENTLKLRSEMVRKSSRTMKRLALKNQTAKRLAMKNQGAKRLAMKNQVCHVCEREGVSTENIMQEHIFSNEKYVDVLELNAKNIFRVCEDCTKDISARGIESCVSL